jgi:Spy/CpxP family protein refolding chaperone
MRSRLTKTLLAAATVSALALPAGAQARHGADDPAGHARHSSSEVRHHARHSSRTTARHHARHGADDGPNHT